MEKIKCAKCGKFFRNNEGRIPEELYSGYGLDDTLYYHFKCWKDKYPEKYLRVNKDRQEIEQALFKGGSSPAQ